MRTTGLVVAIVVGLFTIVGSLFGWGFYLGNRLTKIDDRMVYVENFLKNRYPKTFVTANLAELNSRVSPFIAQSNGEKAAMGNLVALSESDKSLVLYNPSTKTTDSVSI